MHWRDNTLYGTDSSKYKKAFGQPREWLFFLSLALWLSLLKTFVFPTRSSQLSGEKKKTSKGFSASFTNQPECWAFWGFKVIHTESPCLCWYYVYYPLNTWLIIMPVRMKITPSKILEQITTDRMISASSVPCIIWQQYFWCGTLPHWCWTFKTESISWWFMIPDLVSICYCLRAVLKHFNYDLWFQFGQRFLVCFNDCRLLICVIKFWSGF